LSLRDSLDLIRTVRPQAGTAALEHEIMVERAASIGAAERICIKCLADLRAASADRPARLAAAQKAVWQYFVQRELIGFRRHTEVIRDLSIPPEVLNGLGAAHTLRARHKA
jgi:hypothetical protein